MVDQRVAVVTGATGRLGRNTVRQLHLAGWRVRGLLMRASPRQAILDRLGAEMVFAPMDDLDALSNAVAGAAVVVHVLGAFQGGGPERPLYYFDANLRSTVNLMVACERANPKPGRFIFISTDAVYDRRGAPDHLLREDDPVQGGGEYTLEKLTGERFCQLFHPHRMPCVVIRAPMMINVDDVMDTSYFGYFTPRLGLGLARQRAAGGSPAWQEALAAIEAACKRAGQLMVFRGPEGRCFTKHLGYVVDVARGIALAAEGDGALGETFNIMSVPFDFGAAGEILRAELSAPVEEVTMPEIPINWEYDLSKAKRLLGYEPQFDAARVAREVVAWKRGQPLDAIPNTE